MELEEAEHDLRYAQRILADLHRYQPEEWLLLATLVGEADLAIQQHPQASPQLRALLAEVVGDLCDVTDNFTKPEFLRATRPARRRNKGLFCGR